MRAPVEVTTISNRRVDVGSGSCMDSVRGLSRWSRLHEQTKGRGQLQGRTLNIQNTPRAGYLVVSIAYTESRGGPNGENRPDQTL